MGQLCDKNTQTEIAKVEEKDYVMPPYTSKADKFFNKVEGDYMLLSHFQLIEFLVMIANYTSINKLSAEFRKDKSYYDDFTREDFQTFVEKKILKNFLIYAFAGEDERLSDSFKDILISVFSNLQTKINQSLKPNTKPCLQKYHAIPLGLLYCHAKLRAKVKFLFNLFVDDFGYFSPTPEFNEFILSLFFIPSYCMCVARNIVGQRNSRVGEFADEEKFSLLDAFETKDILRLRKIFMKGFFQEKTGLTFEEFKKNFEEKEYLWIFSPRGIRSYLEKYNDVDGVEQEIE